MQYSREKKNKTYSTRSEQKENEATHGGATPDFRTHAADEDTDPDIH